MNFSQGSKGVIVIEGHVQGLANTRALGRAGIPVIVVSEHNCLARYSRYCKKFYKCPAYLSSEFVDFLIQMSLKESIHDWILLPSNDHAVYNISQNTARLKDHYKIISPMPMILEKIYNKELLIRLCKSIDVPVPQSWFPSVQEEICFSDLRYPLLVKGKNGLTFYKEQGRKAFMVNDKENLDMTIKVITRKSTFSNIYLQNLLPVEKNKAVSFTAFSIEGVIKSYWIGEKIREHPINFGTATYSRAIINPSLFPLAEKLLKELSFTGVCEIEFLLDQRDSQYKLIEINARTWLWLDLAIKSGINYPLMIYDFMNQKKTDYPLTYSNTKEWMHYLTDIPYSLLGLIRGNYSVREIFKSYAKFPSPAVFDFNDILPSFAEIALLPVLILKR